MLDLLLQNFSWPTFFIAFGVFAMISSIVTLIKANFNYRIAKTRLQIMQKRHKDLVTQLKDKSVELDDLLSKNKWSE